MEAFHTFVRLGNSSLLENFLCRRKKANKKKFRQGHDYNSIALNEAHDIFGNVEDLLQRRKQVDASEWKERRLEDEFEPVVISDKYMTEKDDHIRELDVPERMQV